MTEAADLCFSHTFRRIDEDYLVTAQTDRGERWLDDNVDTKSFWHVGREVPAEDENTLVVS